MAFAQSLCRNNLDHFHALSLKYPGQLDNIEFSPFTKGVGGDFTAQLRLPSEVMLVQPNDQENIHVNKTLKCLPPIQLSFSLPPEYPCDYREKSNLPQFLINSVWLSSNRCQQIIDTLVAICYENPNQEVLAKIFDYIQEDFVLSLLDWDDDKFVLDACQLYFDLTSEQIDQKLGILIDFNDQRNREIFLSSEHHCEVCDEDYIGTYFVTLIKCDHFFCKECLSASLKTYISYSSFSAEFKCLKCDESMTMNDIKSIGSADLLEQYEKILLTRSVKRMHDVANCPRAGCGIPVLVESELNVGRCPKCNYSFCPRCARSYHGLGLCDDEEDLKPDPEDVPNKVILLETYQSSSGKYRDFLNRVYGVERIEKADNEEKTSEQLKQFRKCPKCQIPVEKISGCNRMQCSVCNQVFCWRCMASLDASTAYNHTNHCKAAVQN